MVRRPAGATHSFRLSVTASNIVENNPPFRSLEGRPYPRGLGGKSALVSEAICYYFANSEDNASVYDLHRNIEGLQEIITGLHERLNNDEDEASTPTWSERFWRIFRKSE
jgi:hypothetical protein|tara:strand:+ start:161 stop:490 length:330 start_codon:yes stop_codon:yes gene_type:complete